MNLLTQSLKLVNAAKKMEYGVDRMSLKDFACSLYGVVPTNWGTWSLLLKEIIAGIDEKPEKVAPRVAALLNERFSLSETASLEELAAMVIYARTYGNHYLALASLLSMIDREALFEFMKSSSF